MMKTVKMINNEDFYGAMFCSNNSPESLRVLTQGCEIKLSPAQLTSHKWEVSASVYLDGKYLGWDSIRQDDNGDINFQYLIKAVIADYRKNGEVGIIYGS